MRSFILFLALFSFGKVQAQTYGWYTEGDFEPVSRAKVTIVNTLNIERSDCPVIIPANLLPVQSLDQTWVTVVDPTLPPQPRPTIEELKKIGSGAALEETNGHAIPYQFDDINQDGLGDEIFFMTDYKPGETKTFFIYFGENWRGGTPHETHAGMGTYGRHLVPWWESKLIGWKMWYPNSVDLYGKRTPMLVANLEGSGEISGYTAPYEFGSDILSVAETFGAGGICLFEDPDRPDVISRPRFNPNQAKGPIFGTRFAFHVVVNGPLRSMIRAHTMHWQTGSGDYELEQLYTAYKNKSYSTCKVAFLRFHPKNSGTQFGCGMRKIMNQYKLYKEDGVIISFGKDLVITDPDVDPLWETQHTVDFEAIALMVKNAYRPVFQEISDFGGNVTFRIPVTENHTYEYLIAAGWSEGTVNRSEREFTDYVLNVQKEYNNPVVVKNVSYETK
ncbi:MAG: DUF4861 family protein [Candidatus Latescibacteria bacterium]|nr:DUF4861 family protein [Candidatus Latescibacterota bacterium]